MGWWIILVGLLDICLDEEVDSPPNSLEGGNLADDVLDGVGEPLVEGDGVGVVDVHLGKVPLAGRQPVGLVLEHGLGGGGESEAAGGHHSRLDHPVKLGNADSAVPRLCGRGGGVGIEPSVQTITIPLLKDCQRCHILHMPRLRCIHMETQCKLKSFKTKGATVGHWGSLFVKVKT